MVDEDDKAVTSPLTSTHRGSLRHNSIWGTWRVTVSAGATVTGAILITNLSVLIWLKSFPTHENFATVFTGSCTSSKRIIIWVELAVNVMSTLLLGASNACAQILTSPTRYEISKAHARRRWMDIGIPNYNNLSSIAGWRVTLWSLLFISSVPLHLVYNAVFFSTTTLYDHQIALVTESFLEDGYWNQSRLETYAQESALDTDNYTSIEAQSADRSNISANLWPQSNPAPAALPEITKGIALLGEMQTEESTLKKHMPSECAKMYSNFLYERSWRSMLIVVSLDLTDNVIDIRQLKPESKFTNLQLYQEDHSWLCSNFSQGSQAESEFWSSGNFSACRKLGATGYSWFIPQARQCNSRWLRHSTPPNGKLVTSVDLTSCNTFETAVQYCLVDPVQSSCSIRVSIALLIWVVCCNLIKFGCMVTTLFFRNFEPLVTIGDALVSFLEDPDDMTAEIGTISLKDVWDAEGRFPQKPFSDIHKVHCPNPRCPCLLPWNDHSSVTGHLSDIGPKRLWLTVLEYAGTVAQPFKAHTIRWVRTGNLAPWFVCIGFCTAAWFTRIAFLVSALHSSRSADKSLPGLWKLGLGSFNLDNLVTGSGIGLTSNALIANTPQVILSCAYLIFNKTLTGMVLAQEFNSFTSIRKTLRVSKPRGGQRGTFWFQLPYRYILPLMSSMAVLHWLAARSIFLIELTIIGYSGDRSVNTCGFSPISIILTLCLGGVLILILVGLSLQKLKPGMPVTGSCSLAISATCHAAKQEEDVAILPLMYGVPIEQMVFEDYDGTVTLRAGFSSREVTPLIDGVVYRNRFSKT